MEKIEFETPSNQQSFGLPRVISNQSVQGNSGALRDALDLLNKREQYLINRANMLQREALTSKGNKALALSKLKQKKIIESQIETLVSKRMTIELSIMNLESASLSQQVMNALKIGSSALISSK